MVYADSLDFYEVRRMGALTGDNMKTLSRCYLPLIGVEALGVYFALYWDLTVAKSGVETHQSFFRRALVSSGVFERSLNALEATGLVKTFREEDKGQNYFVYCVYPPLSAPNFIKNILLRETLKGIVGEEAFERINETIVLEELPQGMKEETTSFDSFFKTSYENGKEVKHKTDSKGKNEIPTDFSKKVFIDELEKIGLRYEFFTDSELDYCCQLATFYQMDEKTMAGFVFNSFRIDFPKGQRVEVKDLSKRLQANMKFTFFKKQRPSFQKISSSNRLAQLAQQMDEMPPLVYLTWRQEGRKPSKKDIDIIEHLYIENGLSGPCINAVISYVLETNNNVLSLYLCESLAGDLKREGCQSARDAMDFLKTLRKKSKNASFAKNYSENRSFSPSSNKTIMAKSSTADGKLSREDFEAALDEYLDEKGDLK